MKFSFYAFDAISLRETIARAILADSLHFDYFLIPDEVPSTGYRDPFIALSLAGWNTRNIVIGTNITNPYTRHPALIATAFNSLYEITNGRVILGISVGGAMPLKPLGIPMWIRPLKTLEEAIRIIKSLFSGEEVTFNGEIFSIENVKLYPKPKRKIPVLIGARGPKMLQLSGRLAEGVLGSVPIPKIPYLIENVKKGAKKEKRELTNFIFSNGIPFSLSRTREQAYSMVKPEIAGFITFLNDSLVLESGLTKSRMEEIRIAFKRGDKESINNLITEDIINNFSISGTTKDVSAKIKELRDLGINNIIVQPPFGDSVEYTTKVMSKEIMPLFNKN